PFRTGRLGERCHRGKSTQWGIVSGHRQRLDDDDAARAKVLAAADRLFYMFGIQAVGMDALRAEAGVPLKRLYRLFPSKESIVEQVLLGRREMWNALVENATTGGDPRRRLLAIYDALA